jgi:Flp pilus assembly protein TadD
MEEVVPFLPEPGVIVRGDGGGETPAVDARRAEERYRRALALQPDQPVAMLGLALALLRLGDPAGAQASLHRLEARNGKDPEVVLALGNVTFAAGETRAAVEQFRRALELRPGWPAATKNLALALEADGDRVSARRLWESIREDGRLGAEARRHLAALP